MSFETVVQVAIMLVIGLAPGRPASGVHNVAAAHGRGGWLAWADAVVLELMSIASGLELRRRHLVALTARFPASVMVTAVCLSISAQVVVEAQQSPSAGIAAAIPALGFLVMVKIAMAQRGPPGQDANGLQKASPAAQPGRRPITEPASDVSDPVVMKMLGPARSAADEIARRGRVPVVRTSRPAAAARAPARSGS